MSIDVVRFERLWNYAVHESSPNPEGATGQLLRAFAEVLTAEVIEYTASSQAATFLLDLGSQPFAGMGLNVIIVTHPPADEAESRATATLLAEYREAVRSIGLCIHVLLQEDMPTPNPHVPTSTDIIYLAKDDLERIFTSRAPGAALFSVIKRYMHLERLNPFNTTDVARGSMFVGRRREVDCLVKDQSKQFLVMGARLIGKTSLLIKARDVLCVDQEVRNRVSYFDCSNWGGYRDCVVRLMAKLDPKKERRAEVSLREVTFMMRRQSHDGRKPLLLFFDEFDGLTTRDFRSGWQFTKLLAEAVANQWIRVVFAGFRDVQALRQAWHGMTDSPFLGGLDLLNLGPLEQRDARSLLFDPLSAANIELCESDALVSRVLEHSAGQPFIVQFYGESLFRLGQECAPSEVTLDDVQQIEESDELSGFLMNHFVWNTENATHVASDERACVLLYVHLAKKEAWSQQDFETNCFDHYKPLGMGPLTVALQNLLHAQILAQSKRRYVLAFPLLHDVLLDAYPNLDKAMQHLKEAS
jgi:hypothetical protein